MVKLKFVEGGVQGYRAQGTGNVSPLDRQADPLEVVASILISGGFIETIRRLLCKEFGSGVSTAQSVNLGIRIEKLKIQCIFMKRLLYVHPDEKKSSSKISLQ